MEYDRLLSIFLKELKMRLNDKTNWGRNQLLEEIEDVEKVARLRLQDDIMHDAYRTGKHQFVKTGGV